MTIIHPKDTHKVIASDTTTIWEYLMDEPSLSGAVAEINGRYPEKGFAANKISKELAFVISGRGTIITPKIKHTLEVGDVIFLDKGEQFAWEGTFSIFMVTSPKFNSHQHKIIS